MNTDCQIHFC